MLRPLFMLLLATTVRAQTPEPGSNLTISLVTFGNGADVYELFGHNGIWIHDATTGSDTLWNWGVFDRTQPYFIPHFLQGRMLYSMTGNTMEETMNAYRFYQRSVIAQELNLTPAQRKAIKDYIEWNALPQNRPYLYDYFRDNCSTRVRDILDRALGGAIKTGASKQMRGRTYRWHALRLMQVDKPLVSGVHLGLGEPPDRPISVWEEMFLPRIVHDYVQGMRTADGQPLVKQQRVLYDPQRFPEPEAPPPMTLWFAPIGLALAGLFYWLGRRAGRGATIAMVTWSIVAGLLGVILTLLWTATNHFFAHQNENLLLINPLWLALPVLMLMRRPRGVRAVSLALAALSGVAVLLHVTTLSRQDNWAIIALVLPPTLALAWVTDRRSTVSS